MTTAHIRIRRGTIALLLMVLMFVSIGAWALTDANNIEFTLVITPTVLKEPGPVTAKITVTNKGTEDITVPMTVFDANDRVVSAAFDGGVLALLKAGESREWEGPWTVSQQHLDAGRITFNLRLNTTDASGAIAQVSLAATANITYEGERVALQVNRTIQPEVVRPNSPVTVTYTLQNAGTVPLTDIRVRENRLIATSPQTAKALEPGESTTVVFTKQAGSSALESSALVEYRRAGVNTQLRQSVDKVAIPLARPGFSSELTADKDSVTIGEKITLTLTLVNEGNINYTDIDVNDAKLGSMWQNLVLPAGQTLVQTKDITMMTPTTFQFSITLADNTGTTQVQSSNELRVSAYEEGQQMKLNLQVTADRTSIDTLPGLVRFTMVVTNDSNTLARPVNLYHGETRIASLAELQPGQSVTQMREFNLSQAGRYRFSARTVDALDNTVSFEAEDITIAYAPATAAPTREVIATVAPVVTYSPVPITGDNSALDNGRDTLFILVVGLGVLFAGSLALFLVSSAMRARTASQSKSAFDHLQTAPRRDYSDPDTYQGEDTQEPDKASSDDAASAAVTPEELPHQKYLKEDAPLTPAPSSDATPIPDSPLAQGDEGYRLVRENTDQPDTVERGKRRAAKHHKLPEDE